MDYNYNPTNYMNPYPNIQYPIYRNPVQSIPGPQLDKVNGIDSARAFPTKPNSTIPLFDANDDIMYIKSTDSNNFATIRRFRFYEELEPQSIPEETGFVTKAEFDAFKEEILNGKQFVRNNKPTDRKHKSTESSTTDKKSDDCGSE